VCQRLVFGILCVEFNVDEYDECEETKYPRPKKCQDFANIRESNSLSLGLSRWIFKFSIRRSFQKQNLKRKNETQNGQVEEISRDAEKKSTSSKVRRYIKEGK